MNILSRNGKWITTGEKLPLSNSIAVVLRDGVVTGFCIISVNNAIYTLHGGVWLHPPDIQEYENNTLLGHTGLYYPADHEACNAAYLNGDDIAHRV